MSFAFPAALTALLLIPYFIWLGLPSETHRRGRKTVALITRILIALALILGLAGMRAVRKAEGLAVVFLIDASDSMPPEALESARQTVEAALSEMTPEDQAAVILFGADAVVERPMSTIKTFSSLQSEVITTHTDLDEAIRLGMALFPPGLARRMVIISDGLVNVGDAEAAAELAAASNIQISAIPRMTAEETEVLIRSIDLPTKLAEGQVFDLTITAESTETTTATLRIIGGDEILIEEEVRLNAGLNRFSYQMEASAPGLTGFRAQIIPAGEDSFHQNNDLASFTQVTGPPAVLIAAQDEEEVRNLGEALLAGGLRVSIVDSESFPQSMATLAQYQTVILANTPAKVLGHGRMELIESYVKDLGGGLIVIGGPEAYGPGGYFETPLEEILPVEMQLKDQERIPQMTLLYLIDKSGSMSDTSLGGIPKIELAKEAIIRAVGLLTPLDRVGVISFDENASFLVPIGPSDNRDEIANQVGGLRASGGTDIYAGVLAASQTLPAEPGDVKHIVLLTDGGASPEGIRELVEEMYNDHGISFTVIAIGEGYAEFLDELPVIADGRFHHAFNVDTIPEIFTEETILISRAYIIEVTFTPTLTASSPIMTGISASPPLHGYIGSTTKPAGTQVLTAANDDPLLSTWQYGLGRAVAWTSDASGRWAADWLSWEEYARFWSQAVRWSIVEGANQNAEVRITSDGETNRITVDVLDDQGGYLNDLDLIASVISPDLDATPVELRQVGPGRYEGEFTPEEEGAYFIRVGGDDRGLAQTTGWVMSYSPEYRADESDLDMLTRITETGGGELLDSAEGVFSHDLETGRAYQPIWEWLVTFAAFALPIDIAIRRLVVTREDVQRFFAKIFPARDKLEEAPARESSAGALFAAKDRAATKIDRGGLAEAPPVEVESGYEEKKPAPEPKQEKRPEGSTVSSLLDSKRSRRED